MGDLTNLLTTYSITEIIIFIVLMLVVIKFLNELISYFYSKFKNHFDVKNQEDANHNEIIEKLDKLTETVHKTNSRIDVLSKEVQGLQEQTRLTTDRLQESTKSFLIDKHHELCYKLGKIDDFSLQNIERRYMFYKAAGGNTFIDQMMNEIRALPRENLYCKLKEEKSEEEDNE